MLAGDPGSPPKWVAVHRFDRRRDHSEFPGHPLEALGCLGHTPCVANHVAYEAVWQGT